MIYRSLKVGTFSVRCKITGTDFPRHYMDYGLYYHYSGYTFPHIAERKKRDTFAWYDTNNKTVMEEIMQLDNVFQYNELLHCETLHPLVNVIDFSTCTPAEHIRFCLGFYAVFLKDVKCGDIQYGRSTYDYQEGTLVFIAPGPTVRHAQRNCQQGYPVAFRGDSERLLPFGQAPDHRTADGTVLRPRTASVSQLFWRPD